MIADFPDYRFNGVFSGREVFDAIRLILPVLDRRAIGTAGDKAPVESEVEPFIGGDVKHKFIVVF